MQSDDLWNNMMNNRRRRQAYGQPQHTPVQFPASAVGSGFPPSIRGNPSPYATEAGMKLDVVKILYLFC